MNPLDMFGYIVGNMRHRHIRSWLTVLSIVVGIAAVVSLVSVAQGLNKAIFDELAVFGMNFVTILPGNFESMSDMGSAAPGIGVSKASLTTNDVQLVKRVPGVKAVLVELGGQVSISYREKNASVLMDSFNTDSLDQIDYKLQLERGRIPTMDEDRGVVLGYSVAHDLFNEEIGLNRPVVINGKTFRVVGILAKGGGLFGSSMDGIILMNNDAGRDVLGTAIGKNEVQQITAYTNKNVDPEVVGAEMEKRLMNAHKVTEDTKDFTVMTPKYITETIGAITGVLTLFLGGLSAISLIVGAVGVANTMFMAVLERTQEIGILKSIGASNRTIMLLFVFEATMLAGVGGILGVMLGTLISYGISTQGLPTYVSPELAAFGVFFAMAIGAVSGFFPAKRAADMEAIAALNYGW